jgi:hypothetical protein
MYIPPAVFRTVALSRFCEGRKEGRKGRGGEGGGRKGRKEGRKRAGQDREGLKDRRTEGR